MRALHDDVAGPWSGARAITVTAAPATPAGFDLFAIITEPGNGYGGNSTSARVMLNQAAPAGGALVTLASNIPQAEVPSRTVTIPAGKTDVSLIRSPPGRYRRMELSESYARRMARVGNRVPSAFFRFFTACTSALNASSAARHSMER